MSFLKRAYHPGLKIGEKKLCLPYCKENLSCTFFKPVWGNKIQEIQLNTENNYSYNTDEINHYSKQIKKFFKNNTLFLPTSHNTPVKTAFRSLRNI